MGQAIKQAVGGESMDSNLDDRTALAVLTHRVETMHSDFTEMRVVLRDLTVAINKLAVVEERQGSFAEAQERGFKTLAKVEERLSLLEKRVPENDRVRSWVDRVATAAVGVVLLFVLKATGLI